MEEDTLKTIRVSETWQLAGVYYVRTEGMVKGFHIPLDWEFADDSPSSQYLLLLDRGLPVATCRLRLLTDTTAKIERVCVLESHRDRNIGKRLITDAEAWFRELGIKIVIIASRDAVVGFYEKLGYRADWNQIHQGFFKEVHMEKGLS
ncbi:MAG: GNAT family N-acetyltransferase [Treponema sp.]|jgi:GNAT superfamily N-acetyltransferase|nr:GNAT family N-acetyltransferase [Treponema sp.]